MGTSLKSCIFLTGDRLPIIRKAVSVESNRNAIRFVWLEFNIKFTFVVSATKHHNCSLFVKYKHSSFSTISYNAKSLLIMTTGECKEINYWKMYSFSEITNCTSQNDIANTYCRVAFEETRIVGRCVVFWWNGWLFI